jgi:hypothetical protein
LSCRNLRDQPVGEGAPGPGGSAGDGGCGGDGGALPGAKPAKATSSSCAESGEPAPAAPSCCAAFNNESTTACASSCEI